jgi:hypothetical protein
MGVCLREDVGMEDCPRLYRAFSQYVNDEDHAGPRLQSVTARVSSLVMRKLGAEIGKISATFPVNRRLL